MPQYQNEASAMTVRARFFNESSDLVTPTSVRYLIRDLTNDRLVRDWTSLSPAATIDIQITADDNDLHTGTRRNRKFERRVVTVQADTDTPTQRTDEIEYWVRNLAGIAND
jgi:hypothetical protein